MCAYLKNWLSLYNQNAGMSSGVLLLEVAALQLHKEEGGNLVFPGSLDALIIIHNYKGIDINRGFGDRKL